MSHFTLCGDQCVAGYKKKLNVFPVAMDHICFVFHLYCITLMLYYICIVLHLAISSAM